MRILKKLQKNSFNSWLQSATDQELADGYEVRRVTWLKNGQDGTGIKTPEMQMIEREMSRRSAEKWAKDPRRNTDPNFRWTDANRWEKD